MTFAQEAKQTVPTHTLFLIAIGYFDLMVQFGHGFQFCEPHKQCHSFLMFCENIPAMGEYHIAPSCHKSATMNTCLTHAGIERWMLK